MHNPKHWWAATLFALLAAGGFSSAQAADETKPGAAAPPADRVALFGVKPMQGDQLAKSRGGTQVLNDMKLRGTVTNNSAVDVSTGNNVIADGAFAGASGLPMVIQNSGNNVLIQNATIVNVQMK